MQWRLPVNGWFDISVVTHKRYFPVDQKIQHAMIESLFNPSHPKIKIRSRVTVLSSCPMEFQPWFYPNMIAILFSDSSLGDKFVHSNAIWSIKYPEC